MNSVFILLYSIYQTCQMEVKLFRCFTFSLATCTKNQEQSIAWTDNKRVHHLIWLSETINTCFSSCTFKPDIHSNASDLSLDAFAPATLDPFLPPWLTVRAPETLKQQSSDDPNSKYFMTSQSHEIKSRQKICIALSRGQEKGGGGGGGLKRVYLWTLEL